MKRNKSILASLFAVMLAVMLPLGADAVPRHSGRITVKVLRLEQRGEFLHVDMDVALNGVDLPTAQGLDLIPVLATGERSVTLPSIALKGRNQYKADERSLAVMSRREAAAYEAPEKIEKILRPTSKVIEYRHAMPYEPWMADARLDLRYDYAGCGDVMTTQTKVIASSIDIESTWAPYNVVPYLAYVQPVVEAVKMRQREVECRLNFVVNKWDIRPGYMNNPQEMGKIYALLDELRNDPGITIRSIDIIGYASPEGTLYGNQRLSENRAAALRDYLVGVYDFPRHMYSVSYGGENWRGLSKALENANFPYKNEVVRTMNETFDTEVLKRKLKTIGGGEPYRYMLSNIYPSLRVAICKIDFNVQNYNIEQAKEVISTRPQNLSLQEMFLVANTYEKGSREFQEVFITAVRMYPEDPVANLNAASVALSHNDVTSAERYLARVSAPYRNAEYKNAMGVLALLSGDYAEAERYLNEAVTAGLSEAKHNLEELARKKANAAGKKN